MAFASAFLQRNFVAGLFLASLLEFISLRIPWASDTKQVALLGEPGTTEPPLTANLSPKARDYLITLGITAFNIDAHSAELIWMHALAIGYSPAYLIENTDGIQENWPRIPLPDNKDLLFSSVELGRKVATLLDTESPVPGVITRRAELRQIAIITSVDGRMLDPNAGNLVITAGWGHPGKDGVVMPGQGRITKRNYTSQELTALQEGAEALGLTLEKATKHLGETTCDIYLNNFAYWKNVPSKVWNYHIGGYQVIKKW